MAQDLLNAPVISPLEMTDGEFERISRLVMDRCGINLHVGKRELVKARLSKRLRKLGLDSYTAYLRYVEQETDGAELANMLDSLSTNVTYFFREPQHLDHLRDDIVPRLMAQREKDGNRKLRVWSAGCSSGEEPYSIAMVLLETIHDLERWDVKILATDISTRILAKAREGVYEESRFRDTPLVLRDRYFELIDRGPPKVFSAGARLRSLVHFAHLNLMEAWPMRGPFDVIFCRNVMIYFDRPTQTKLINRFSQMLAPGGALIIGHSESLSGVSHKMKQLYPTIYQN